MRNLRHDGWAQLCDVRDGFFGEGVYVGSEADMVSLLDAMEPLVDYFRAVSGEHNDRDDYRRSTEAERRVLIRITARWAEPNRKG